MDELLMERTLEVRDPLGKKILEYDPDSGRMVLHLPAGKLEVSSTHEGIELVTSSSLRIRAGGTLMLQGAALEVDVPRAELRAQEVVASARNAAFSWGKLEQTVGRFFQWAKSVYVRIEEVLHTRAGRIRTQVAEESIVEAREIRLRSAQDVKIQGETIHLG